MTAHVLSPVAGRGLRAGAAGFVLALARGARGVMRTLAYARMAQTLHAMSDAQLAQIGVARADIPAHALALVQGESTPRL